MKRFEPIGKYIHLVDVRNSDLSVKKLLGIASNKTYIPSVANIIGTDLSKYKVIKEGQFSCNLMHVSRDGVVPVALYYGSPAIVSPAYPVFEVNNTEELLPEYLHLYLSSSEFDREAVFHAMVGVRGSLIWEDFLSIKIPVPSIELQRKMVEELKIVEQRIVNNNEIINNLKKLAHLYYHHNIVENIDLNNLPLDWKLTTIQDYCLCIKSGGTPSRGVAEYWNQKDYPWLKTGEVQNNVVVEVEEYISSEGLNNSSAKLIPSGSVVMAMYGGGTLSNVAYLDLETTTNQACCNMICHSKEDAAFLYFHLLHEQDEIKKLANGGAQENLSIDLISNQSILTFKERNIKQFFLTILEQLVLLYRENSQLVRVKNVLLENI